MTSTSQLAIGFCASKDNIKGLWIQHNLCLNKGHHVSSNNKFGCLSVCICAPKVGHEKWKKDTPDGCHAHIRCKPQKDGTSIVTSVDLEHTCTGVDAKRKRAPRSKDLASVTNTFEVHEPTKSKEGNAKQSS